MSIQFKTIKQLGEMLNNKEISHVELIQETFSLITKNNHLNAFVTLNEQESLKKAENDKFFVNSLPIIDCNKILSSIFLANGAFLNFAIP